MGKKIDGFVLSVLAAAGMYLYFCRATGNHTVALPLACITFLLIARIAKRISARIRGSAWMQKRRFRRQAGSAIMQLACMDSDAARKLLAGLLNKCYQCNAPLELVQAPPSVSLPQERVFDLWKKHRNEDKLIICASCAADSASKSLCASLKQPRIALLDANSIVQMLAEHPECFPAENGEVSQKKRTFKQLAALLIQRRNAPRCLLFSAVMLLMYLLGGRTGNLIASMALLFLALSAFHRPSRPAKLF